MKYQNMTTSKHYISDGNKHPCFDNFRYRNFRTFTSPHPVQFSSLTLDPSGDIVCAGGLDSFDIYVWSMQTGRLLEV